MPTGVLIANLGTPAAPEAPAVRRYLAEFLSDRRVIELPRLFWLLILHGWILRTRPRRSAEAYRRIWTAEGSPLLVNSNRQAAALRSALGRDGTESWHVELGMRYGQPSIAEALEKLRQADITRLLVLPLYPQYSGTTTGSTFDAVASALRGWRRVPELFFVSDYHDDPGYIEALVESIRLHQAEHGRPERLLFSFHGIPKRYVDAGDPYHAQCLRTARLIAAELELPQERWTASFQSRFGAAEWLQPYTDKLLRQWAGAGITSVQVICPGFSADCLETLEEIAMQNREHFLEAGGREYSYVPALNDQPAHIEALLGVIRRY